MQHAQIIMLVCLAICILAFCAFHLPDESSAWLQEIRSKCDVSSWWSPTPRRVFLMTTTRTMTMMMKMTPEREDLFLQWVESWSMTSSHRPIRSVGLTMWLLKTWICNLWDRSLLQVRWFRLVFVFHRSSLSQLIALLKYFIKLIADVWKIFDQLLWRSSILPDWRHIFTSISNEPTNAPQHHL